MSATHALDLDERLAAIVAAAGLHTAVAYLNAENAAAVATAALILDLPARDWYARAQTLRARLTFGALDYFLEVAREDLDRDASRSYTLSVIVVRCSRELAAPAHADYFRASLRGRGWKEHGNALLMLGRFRHAHQAACRAVRIFDGHSALLVERTAALVIKAFTWHKLDHTAEAARLLRECNAVFLRLGEESRSLQVAIMEGAMLFDAGKTEDARSAFLGARVIAERLRDLRELARILNNLGQCELSLKNIDAAIQYTCAALELFEQQGMIGERQRAFWILARIQREHGRVREAVAELLQVRRELVARGMMIDAALAGLDLIELLAATDEHDLVKQEAETLVRVFTEAGMQRNARIALAYLVEQAKLQGESSTDEGRLLWQQDLQRVRIFMTGLRTAPESTFTAPH